MPSKRQTQKAIQVCAHWQGMDEPVLMGTLFVTSPKGEEVFSFEYDQAWLESPHAQELDPHLVLFTGRQYARDGLRNFGLFLDSSPDRWGRVLMERREEQQARTEKREADTLLESDYLLGVYDAHRMGALRFRLSDDAPFLDNQANQAAPPWTKLRELEHASLQLERDNAEDEKDYPKWLNMLIAPGSSLGGARPKACVLDEAGHPWIAKFPSRRDKIDIGKWEYLVHLLAQDAGIEVAQSKIEKFSGEYNTFLTKRFDRTENNERLHFTSAMTLLGKKDGDGADTNVSYLNLAGFLARDGARVKQDMEQLWRRIVFYVCVSNTDDHLRNHGFMLTDRGWALSPAYDMNPVAKGNGLSLNISENDNEQDLELVLSVANHFRVDRARAYEIIQEVKTAVKNWPTLASQLSIPSTEVNKMKDAFRIVSK
ncbi:MAG: type II toxin-antitoxin system HipA family toxin [Hyphomicrobiales bacterium]|nr:type II toxin-antitoxin system HipA family toxin [Hyphomicrobiales bacterium]